MPWEKPAEALVARFQAILPDDPRVERRRMFGCPCAFTGGNMFAGVHEQKLILRLPSGRREALIGARTAQPFVVMGRRMGEYVALEEALGAEEATLRSLLAEAFGYASSLPPKEKKPRARRGAARG